MPRNLPPGFSRDHKPLVEIKLRKKNGQVVDTVPTRKNVCEGGIRTSGPLVADLIMHLDAMPHVVQLSSFPCKVQIELYDRYGVIGKEEHIPELGALMVDGSARYLDAVSVKEHKNRVAFADRAERINERLVRAHDATYAFFDEDDLHVEPRMSNLRNVWMHHHYIDDGKDVIARVRRALHDTGFPTTIAHVCNAVDLPPFEWPDWAGRVHLLPTVNPVSSALKAMHCRGEVVLDLGRLFSPQTAVFAPRHSLKTWKPGRR